MIPFGASFKILSHTSNCPLLFGDCITPSPHLPVDPPPQLELELHHPPPQPELELGLSVQSALHVALGSEIIVCPFSFTTASHSSFTVFPKLSV